MPASLNISSHGLTRGDRQTDVVRYGVPVATGQGDRLLRRQGLPRRPCRHPHWRPRPARCRPAPRRSRDDPLPPRVVRLSFSLRPRFPGPRWRVSSVDVGPFATPTPTERRAFELLGVPVPRTLGLVDFPTDHPRPGESRCSVGVVGLAGCLLGKTVSPYATSSPPRAVCETHQKPGVALFGQSNGVRNILDCGCCLDCWHKRASRPGFGA